MGCAITFPNSNPLLSESEHQVLKAIKTCEIQTLAHYLSQYLDVMSTQYYYAKINQVYKKLKDTEQTYLKNNEASKENRIIMNRSHHINYHMDQVLKNIKLADELLEQLKKQRQRLEKNFKDKKMDWVFTIAKIMENTKKKKMFSQIVVDTKQIEQQRKMKEQKMAEKIEECKERISQCLSQVDINQQQRNIAVMTQISELQSLIKKQKEQVGKLNEEKKKLTIKIKEITTNGNLELEEKQKKYNRVEKLLDQARQENENLTKQNNLLKQQNEKMKSQFIMQKQSLLTEVRKTQINIHHLNLDNVRSKIHQNGQDKSESQFQKSNSFKNWSKMSTQVEKSQKQIRSISNQTAKSVQFKKFSHSVIINKGLRASQNYKNIVDKIFAPLKIENTIPIFAYDKVRPNNMNQYVKKQENLLILAQLKNGTIIGGFSRFGFKQSSEKLKENICFIFYIHSQKEYQKLQLKQQSMAKYSAKLDQNYLKIGENEIRITCGKNECSSNVGSSSSIFGRKDKKINVTQFLGFKQSQQGNFELQNYEIFQLSVDYPEEVLKKCKIQLDSMIYE